MPANSATPLISVGKAVRVQVGERSRRATIAYVDEAGGKVDVLCQVVVISKSASGILRQRRESKEPWRSLRQRLTLPISAIKALEEFEEKITTYRGWLQWIQSFSDDLYGAVTMLKQGADDLFIEAKDYDAAAEYYDTAIDALEEEVQPSIRNIDGKSYRTAVSKVLLPQAGQLVVGSVTCFDALTQQVFASIPGPECVTSKHGFKAVWPGQSRRPHKGQKQEQKQKLVKALLHTVIPLHMSHLLLQGSLHSNRARIYIQAERLQDALQDLSLVICFGKIVGDVVLAHQDQLAKAFLLRAKIYFCRLEVELAKNDIAAAFAFVSYPETSKIVRQLLCEINNYKAPKAEKENKKPVEDEAIAKDIAILAGTLPID